MDYARASDEELAVLLVDRDERALEGLYDRYSRPTFSLVIRMLRDPARAEEVTQEVFLKLWRRPTGFDPGRGTFATWLLSVAHHRAVDELRTRRLQTMSLDGENQPGSALIDDGYDLAELAWIREQRAAVRAALATLPEAQRRAVEMAYFLGLTQREISDRLGEPLGTIKTRLRLAVQKLRIVIDASFSPDPNAVTDQPLRAEMPVLAPSQANQGRHADL